MAERALWTNEQMSTGGVGTGSSSGTMATTNPGSQVMDTGEPSTQTLAPSGENTSGS